MLTRLDVTVTGPQTWTVTPLINEGEAFQVTVRPINSSLAAATPSSMRYRIDDLIQGNVIADWATLIPSTAVTITVSSQQNAIRNGLSKERRQIVIEASDTDGPIRRTLEYDVVDIQGIP